MQKSKEKYKKVKKKSKTTDSLLQKQQVYNQILQQLTELIRRI